MVFISALCLLPLFFNKTLSIPKISLPILLIVCVPIFQYFFGQIFYFENMVLSSIYIFSFWLMLVVGYSLCIDVSFKTVQINSENFITILSYTFIAAGILSCLVSILQWLGLAYDSMLMMGLRGNRPYANMAQPNNLAVFLLMALISLLYLFEKNKINNVVALIISILFILAIILTQSRTVWIIAVFFIIIWIFFDRKYYFRFNKILLVKWSLIFLLILFSLPFLNNFLSNYFNIAQTSTVVERASTGYLRLQLWNQMIHAIIDKPWFGFGWHQTTAAQYAVIDQYHGKEWASSGHNILLDILVWSGIPLGSLIILFSTYLYLILFKSIKNIESFIAFLMISMVFIHAMLEFPLYYSYFLLPVGLLCGLILGQNINLKSYLISYNFIRFLFLAGFLLVYYVFNEYNKISDNIIAANTHEMNELKTEVELPYKLPLFDLFEYRSKWIALYPYRKVTEQQLQEIRHMVQTYLTPYDLHKFSILLAYNGYEQEAKRQLIILNIMYSQEYTYDSLLDR